MIEHDQIEYRGSEYSIGDKIYYLDCYEIRTGTIEKIIEDWEFFETHAKKVIDMIVNDPAVGSRFCSIENISKHELDLETQIPQLKRNYDAHFTREE